MYWLADRIHDQDWIVLIDAANALFTAEADDNRTQAAALAALDWATVAYIVIGYGTNDFRGSSGVGVPMGTNTDANGNTFKGAINYSIQRILSAYPRIRLLFWTPLWRSRVNVDGDNSDLTANGSGLYLRDYVQAIKDRAGAYKVPVFDFHAECGISPLNTATYLSDGLNPYTAAGNQLMVDKLGAALTARF